MKGLLVCRGDSFLKNIGDYIQSIAQEQYLGSDYCLVEREVLNSIESPEKIKVVMNGWFMWHPSNFPPSNAIDPLFISFHLNPAVSKEFFTEKTVEYLKSHEPIGARDIGTKTLIEAHGIKSYFSNCLTLTLGKTYKSQEKNKDVIFVDPYFTLGNTSSKNKLVKYLKSAFLYLRHFSIVNKVQKNFQTDIRTVFTDRMSILHRILCASSFVDAYLSKFSEDVLTNAKYYTHQVCQSKYPSETSMLEYARQLVTDYAKARLVVTSRIHCALPCLGLETPVIFVKSEQMNSVGLRSAGRFNGILDMFNVMSFDANSLSVVTADLSNYLNDGVIDLNSDVKNSTEYVKYIDRLDKTVNDFLSNA